MVSIYCIWKVYTYIIYVFIMLYIYICTACIRFMKGVTFLFFDGVEQPLPSSNCHDWLEFTVNHIQHVDFTNKYSIGSMYGIYSNIGGILMVNVTIYTIHGSYGYVQMTRKKHDWLLVDLPLWEILVNGKDSPIYLQKPSRIDPESISRWIQLQFITIPFLALGGQILFWTLPNDIIVHSSQFKL